MEAFVIDNVATYWDEVHGWQRPFEMTDFPNVAPPFGQWWMEYRIADDQGRRISDDARVGALFSACEDPDRDAWPIACEPYMSGPGLTVGPIDRAHVLADRPGKILDLLGPADVRPEEREADAAAPSPTSCSRHC